MDLDFLVGKISIVDHPYKRHVTSAHLRHALAIVRQGSSDDADKKVEEIIESVFRDHFPKGYKLEEFKAAINKGSSWVNHLIYHSLLERARHAAGYSDERQDIDMFYEEVGARSIRDENLVKTAAIRVLAPIESVFAHVERGIYNYTTLCDMERDDHRGRLGFLVVRKSSKRDYVEELVARFGDEGARELLMNDCHNTTGVFREIPKQYGRGEPAIREVRCEGHGHICCEYEMTYQAKMMDRVRRWWTAPWRLEKIEAELANSNALIGRQTAELVSAVADLEAANERIKAMQAEIIEQRMDARINAMASSIRHEVMNFATAAGNRVYCIDQIMKHQTCSYDEFLLGIVDENDRGRLSEIFERSKQNYREESLEDFKRKHDILSFLERNLNSTDNDHFASFVHTMNISLDDLNYLSQISQRYGAEGKSPLHLPYVLDHMLGLNISNNSIGAIKTTIEHLERVAKAFRRVSRISPLEYGPLKVKQMIDDLTMIYQITLLQHVDVTLDLPKSFKVTGYKLKVNTVLNHLMINAAEALERGRNEGMETRGSLSISSGIEDGFKYISFTNNGPMIPPEKMGEIFTGYSTKGGRGWGLEESLGYMREGKGDIKVYSVPEKTEFRLLFTPE